MIEFEIEKIEEELSMAVKRGKHKNQQQRQTINFKQFFSVSLLPSFPISVDELRRPEKKNGTMRKRSMSTSHTFISVQLDANACAHPPRAMFGQFILFDRFFFFFYVLFIRWFRAPEIKSLTMHNIFHIWNQISFKREYFVVDAIEWPWTVLSAFTETETSSLHFTISLILFRLINFLFV